MGDDVIDLCTTTCLLKVISTVLSMSPSVHRVVYKSGTWFMAGWNLDSVPLLSV